jgi:hypothetical protein
MKLITEYIPNTIETCIEESKSGDKNLYIEGIFMQSELVNRNGRKYPESVLDEAVNKYVTEKVNSNRALGELNHPPRPNVDAERACHRIVEMSKDGTNWMGKALVLNTPTGNIVRGLIEGGTSLGVSSRGLGTLKNVKGVNEVQGDFLLNCVDVVSDPSAPEAFVNGIMEGIEYLVDGSTIHEKVVEEIVQDVKNAPAKDLSETYVRAFMKAMRSIS